MASSKVADDIGSDGTLELAPTGLWCFGRRRLRSAWRHGQQEGPLSAHMSGLSVIAAMKLDVQCAGLQTGVFFVLMDDTL